MAFLAAPSFQDGSGSAWAFSAALSWAWRLSGTKPEEASQPIRTPQASMVAGVSVHRSRIMPPPRAVNTREWAETRRASGRRGATAWAQQLAGDRAPGRGMGIVRRDSAVASQRREGPDDKEATAEVRKPAWWQGRRRRSQAPPRASLRPGVLPASGQAGGR